MPFLSSVTPLQNLPAPVHSLFLSGHSLLHFIQSSQLLSGGGLIQYKCSLFIQILDTF